MKLSEQTVSLLKNFASINQNLLFKSGNKLQTISAQKNILVDAEIPESFPSDFAIYDLNKMLGVMSLFQDPELEVRDKTMKIGGKVNYMFADPAMIVTPPEKELVFPEPEVKFTMTNGDFSQAKKRRSTFGSHGVSGGEGPRGLCEGGSADKSGPSKKVMVSVAHDRKVSQSASGGPLERPWRRKRSLARTRTRTLSMRATCWRRRSIQPR